MIFLSFEKFLDGDMFSQDFNKARYVKSFKERAGLSKVRLDSDAGSQEVGLGGFLEYTHDELLGKRYVAVLALVFDTVVSVYDVDTKTIAVVRFLNLNAKVWMPMASFLNKTKSKNLEVRIIGMQNLQEVKSLSGLLDLLRKDHLKIFEVDLFGTETRHVVFDVKTGMSFDVLMMNRLYKPGERENILTFEQFSRESAIKK